MVDNALVTLVVLIGEERRPISGQLFGIHGKAMVLCCDEAAVGAAVCTWLVVAAVSISRKRNRGLKYVKHIRKLDALTSFCRWLHPLQVTAAGGPDKFQIWA